MKNPPFATFMVGVMLGAIATDGLIYQKRIEYMGAFVIIVILSVALVLANEEWKS
jgi:uncharacterized membrane protein YcaP (DUF421 family)